ncbi:MAG: regulatory iron-sulfur-containing complex subunit RicT [Bacilli bacterium]
MSKIYGVVFKDGGKTLYFKSEKEFDVDNYCIVNTDKGNQFARVIEVNVNKNVPEDIKEILRKASDEDYNQHLDNLKEAAVAFKKCVSLVKELSLKMNVISAQFTFDRTQLLFNFISDERVDFRELAKKLASIYHTRIELRQIGARDKAREIGGVGVCGQKLCCSRFLDQIDAVSMNMAKNQNLALNPSKINGCCGRLLCCLSYEDEQYYESSKTMPNIGSRIKTPLGDGQVISVDVLNRKYKAIVNGEKEEFTVDEK